MNPKVFLLKNKYINKAMATQDLTYTILVDQTPQQAFDAINNVRGWWSEEIEGNTDKLNETFIYQYEDVHYSQITLIEAVPNEKIVWLIKYNYFKFTKDKSEWTGTKVVFEISKKDNKTQIRFTHVGLAPEHECYDICSNAWAQYFKQSLASLIATGKGNPNGKGKPTTADEERLTAK